MNQIAIHINATLQKRIILCVAWILLWNCTSPDKQTYEDLAYRKELTEKLYEVRSEDSLKLLLQQFTNEPNEFGTMLCYKQIGLLQRESSQFSEAINSHQQGLALALQLNDTLEIVQALNNLGANFRRVGAHDEASQHHYQALHYAEVWSGFTTPAGQKSRAVSLSGIGNISLVLENYDDAYIWQIESYQFNQSNRTNLGKS